MSHDGNEGAALPPQGGILLVDKAGGWTSHDVVAKARRALGTRKVGHAGTLDPMATGLLVLGAGPATRLLTHLVGLDKKYTATIRLGIATITDDREGEWTAVADADSVARVLGDPDRVRAAAARLTGAIEQAPSAVSAIKVDGRRSYERVRAGEEVELKKRPVTVHAFELGSPRPVKAYEPSVQPDKTDQPLEVIDIEATVRCSSGTYIRALARDLGAALGIGGHLTALRRTGVGPFSVQTGLDEASEAGGREEFGAVHRTRVVTTNEQLAAGEAGELLAPAEVAARLFPVLELTAEQTVELGHGKRVELHSESQVAADAKLAAAIAPDGRLVGLVEVERGRTRVVTNFPTPDTGASGAERDDAGRGRTERGEA